MSVVWHLRNYWTCVSVYLAALGGEFYDGERTWAERELVMALDPLDGAE